MTLVLTLLPFCIGVIRSLVVHQYNHIVCHGIPGNKILKEGDILNVDVTALKNGWHGDTSRMFYVGDVSIKADKLTKVTYEAMMKAIKILKKD